VGNKFSFAEPSFVNDGEEGDEEQGEEEQAEGGEEQGEGEGEGGDEPEDDYNAAWEVLDVARTIYIKVLEDNKGEEMREERLRLADTYLALADVSCETGKLTYMPLCRIKCRELTSRKLSPGSIRLYICSRPPNQITSPIIPYTRINTLSTRHSTRIYPSKTI
jgi:hypothetical protein